MFTITPRFENKKPSKFQSFVSPNTNFSTAQQALTIASIWPIILALSFYFICFKSNVFILWPLHRLSLSRHTRARMYTQNTEFLNLYQRLFLFRCSPSSRLHLLTFKRDVQIHIHELDVLVFRCDFATISGDFDFVLYLNTHVLCTVSNLCSMYCSMYLIVVYNTFSSLSLTVLLSRVKKVWIFGNNRLPL